LDDALFPSKASDALFPSKASGVQSFSFGRHAFSAQTKLGTEKPGPISPQLPITNYQLPITNYQLPITNTKMPWLQIILDTDAQTVEPISDGLFAIGAISVTLQDAENYQSCR
jgi:hypothetical protein